jgi:hypothetical protein
MYLMSIFCRLGRPSKEFVQVQSSWLFITSLFLRWGVVSPRPNPLAGGSSLVVCPWLLIQYGHSYPPLLEAVPPSATQECAMLWWQGDPLNMEPEKTQLGNSSCSHENIMDFSQLGCMDVDSIQRELDRVKWCNKVNMVTNILVP